MHIISGYTSNVVDDNGQIVPIYEQHYDTKNNYHDIISSFIPIKKNKNLFWLHQLQL